MLGRYDGKTVTSQVVPQSLVGVFQQGRVHDVGDIHLVILVLRLEVQLAEFVLALSYTVYKGALLIGVCDDFGFNLGVISFAPRQVLVVFAVVKVFFVLVEFPHQRVVPGCRPIDAADVGVFKGVAFLCQEDILQNAQVAE